MNFQFFQAQEICWLAEKMLASQDAVMVNECALQAIPRQSLPETQPEGPSILLWPVHTVHFCPWMPGLHTQRPVICSQSSRTDPNIEQPHAENWRKKARENSIT